LWKVDGSSLSTGRRTEVLHPVIPVYIGYCAVFKDREKALTRGLRVGLSKLNSMQATAD
jgi:hypothetical protein